MNVDTSDEFLTPKQAADRYGIPAQTLANKRWRRIGPKFIKLGEGKSARVKYRRSDFESWLDANTVQTNGPR